MSTERATDWPGRLAPWLPLVAFLILVPLFFLGERFEVNGGLGHDGVFYVKVAQDFDRQVWHDGVSRYRVQRLSVSALIHYGARLFGVPLTDARVLEIWRWIDVVCIVLTLQLWLWIASALGIRGPPVLLGLLFLFVNCSVLKWTPFYADLLDMPAYALGAASVFFWLTHRQLALALVTLVGAFTWPTAIYVGLVLLVFPREPDAAPDHPPDHAPDDSPAPKRLALVAAALPATVLVGLLVLFRLRGGVFIMSASWEVTPWTDVAILIAGVYVMLALYPLARDPRWFRRSTWTRLFRAPSTWAALALVIAIKLAQHLLAAADAEGESQVNVVSVMIWTAAMRPAVFLVSHSVFFGPAALIAVLTWPRVCARALACGTGAALALAFTACLSVASESRQLSNLFPLIVPLVVQVVAALHWTRWHYLFATAISLVACKVWLTINPDWVTWLYQLNAGPWFSWWTYEYQGLAVLACAAALTLSGATSRYRSRDT